MTNLSGTNLNNGAAVGPQGEGMESPSNFPPYPAYKDSGVEWLGEVPEHWAVHPLKRAIERIESGTSVNAADFPAEPGSLGVLKTSCVYTGKFDWAENKTVDDEDLSRVSCPLRKDTLIVSRMNTPDLVGATGLVTEAPNGIFLPDRLWQVYFLVNHSPEFLFYFTKSREYREQVKMACSGTSASMQNLGQDDFRGLLFAEPPKPEQAQIARFLDHETARIDALIEEQQRLIELLKEKRQAVISHAVTKGLDPTVPMKDSGVEWLGEVPAHWDVVRVKHIKSWRPNAFVDGPFGSNLKSEHFIDDGGVYVIESGFATTGTLSFSDLKQITPKHFETIQRSEVCAGDIVIAKIGARYGMCSILPWLDKPAVVSGNSLKLTVNEEICDSKFAVFVLQHLKERGAIEDIVNMTAQPALSLGEMNNLPFPLPSLSEQLSIVSELEKELGEFEALTSECKQVMSLAIERRSALISAAVTGKIDVRNW